MKRHLLIKINPNTKEALLHSSVHIIERRGLLKARECIEREEAEKDTPLTHKIYIYICI